MAEITINGSILTKEDLFPIFKKNIGSNYPENEGWKVYNRFNWVSYLHDFVLQREVGEKVERIVVEINTDRKITQEQINQLNIVANRLSSEDVTVIKKILIIKKEAEVNSIPQDFEVFYLNEFLTGTKQARSKEDKDKLVA
ncbi:MAG: hypothetical protein ACI959_002059 [Limisphaerales bacterium]|jgi:hypothetical protein